MEQTALYDLVKDRTNSFRLAFSGDSFWAPPGTPAAGQLVFQRAVSSVSIFLCPTRRAEARDLVGRSDGNPGRGGGGLHASHGGYYGPQGDYAIVAGMHHPHWQGWPSWANGWSGAATDFNASVGPFRAAVLDVPDDPASWRSRDNMGYWSDGTSNQIIVGEKNIYALAVGKCGAAVAAAANILPNTTYLDGSVTRRPYIGDCSIFASGGFSNLSISRSFNARIESNPRLTSAANREHPPEIDTEAMGHWGSFHPGVLHFLLGDGAVRAFPTTTPTGSLLERAGYQFNPDSILAKLGNVRDGNPVTLP